MDQLKILTWNVRRAKSLSPVWKYLEDANPDIALLQEVMGVSERILERYHAVYSSPRTRSGGRQKFRNVILSKHSILEKLEWSLGSSWAASQAASFTDNLLSVTVDCGMSEPLNLVNVYSPAWPIDRSEWIPSDVANLKLAANPDVWCTDLLWDQLSNTIPVSKGEWIVAGDFNSSPTFDDGPRGNRGNRETIRRFNNLGLTDCLSHHTGHVVPTFKHVRSPAIKHQLDYMYVSAHMLERCELCFVGCAEKVFAPSLSDHLPILASFS